MRITNRMMTTNALNNIYRNKTNMSTLEDQYTTQQKIQKPSDDPVVAVRSLKYRTHLTEIKQYVDKNIEDALQWMNITESAMNEAKKLFTQLHTYCEQGSNGTLTENDRSSIIEALKQYKEQVYDLANVDYAGRYVFTGYRTDTALLFDKKSIAAQKNNNTVYTITENLNFSNISGKSYIKGGASYAAGTSGDDYKKDSPDMKTANRLQLSYSGLDEEDTTVTLPNGQTFTQTKGIQGITFTDPKTGAVLDPASYTITTKSLNDQAVQGDAYTADPDEIVFIPETGELIFGTNIYASAQQYSDISVEYTKSEFEAGDIMPEHYFECKTDSVVVNTASTGPGDLYKSQTIKYSNPKVQEIEYEINFSTKLQVNTLAKDAFSTTTGTKIDEIIRAVNDVFDMDDKIKEIDKLILAETNKEEIENLEVLKEQLETEKSLKQTVLENAFSSGMTTAKDAEAVINEATADHGSRYLRLTLTQERLKSQKTDFQEILDNNDGVDLEDSIINFEQAKVIYQASLSCTSTIITKTLLDYL